MYRSCHPSTPLSRLFALLLLLLAVTGACLAAPPSLRFKKLGPLGNDEPSMLSLLQDRQGFIWIGTHTNGLYRYDGYRAIRYVSRTGQPGTLPHDRVSALFEDRAGRIWAGTQEGLARFNPATGNFTVFAPTGWPTNVRVIKNIISDGRDGMWVGTWGGLQHFDPASGQFTLYVHDANKPGSLASNDLNALERDNEGGVWTGTWPGGIDYLAPGASEFVHYRTGPDNDPTARSNIVRALQFDRQGRLWIGTEAGVLRWDRKQPWEKRQHIASPNSRVTGFFIDQSGTLWATTLTAGLLRWDEAENRFDQFVHQADDPYSLPGDNLRAMMQDRGGNLWLASFTDGISLVNLNSSGFARAVPYRIDGKVAPASNALLSLATSPDGKLWLGGNLGLGLYDPATGQVQRRYIGDGKPGALSHSIIYSLYQGSSGPLWVGTSSGLNRLDKPDGSFSVTHFGNTASDFINTIAPGKDGVLWLGTGNSLIRFDIASGKFKLYQNDPKDPGSRAVNGTTAVLEDRKGRLWAGSEWNGGGLDMLDPATGKFRHIRAEGGGAGHLPDDNVTSLYEDAAGRLWVGTARGLAQLLEAADGSISFRSLAAATNNLKTLSIESDGEGRLWVSTIAGLFRIDPADGSAALFTPSDGLTDGFAANSSTAAGGLLYFGGVHGMTTVDPKAVKRTSVAPQVAITDIKLINHSFTEGPLPEGVKLEGSPTAPTALTLSPQVPTFSIEFSALHYTEPLLNRYAYQLEGFDREWVETDAEHRVATYTNLNPGHYVFRVKASNHRGTWNQDAATLRITITPPFWQTWWFRISASAAVLGLLWALYHWRIRRLTRQQAELEKLVAARTVELEESNRKLAALSTTDGLTGVSNRRGFDLALETEWRRASRTGQAVALSMLDVDYFKKYNDHYGHQAGDATLRAVAQLITSHGRRSSDLVARYGGEEFALLSAATDASDAFGVAQAICSELERLIMPHDASPFGHVTISIGVAVLVPLEDSSPDKLVEMADQALYRAKQRGRNQALLAVPE
ncbi:two-component regulator propeller domain-containing protein [Pseudoduganella sp. RAF19]|uniref:ligand-binding sensor domain-containing diguanylate cyclase n=3 Tax=unclassified Pseudoduganella TaxID=2637179 RepID=UPI003F9C5D25